MSQQKCNEDGESDTSHLEVNDSTLTTKNNLKEKDLDSVLKTNVKEKNSFLERWENSRFWLIKGSYQFLRSVWIIIMAIATIIIFLISMLFL